MKDVRFTPEQKRAVETVGSGVIVSAGAGSGKTAVLAARCAHLVCDAPPPHRCNVDALLVLTFTEAAAAEMKNRIVEAIRAKSRLRPDDVRLRDQAALIDRAQISTISSFCLWIVRRWFSELGTDPLASMLDEHESRLLKSEVLSEVFAAHYAAAEVGNHPFLNDVAESASDEDSKQRPRPPLHAPILAVDADTAAAFVRQIDVYGLGEDRGIARFVSTLHDFTQTLPDPESWLRKAVDAVDDSAESYVVGLLPRLQNELRSQLAFCETELDLRKDRPPEAAFYLTRVEEYVHALSEWLARAEAISIRLQSAIDPTSRDDRIRQFSDFVSVFEPLVASMAGFAFSSQSSPRLGKNAPAELISARSDARDLRDNVKEKLHDQRLVRMFASWSPAALVDGLRQTAPFVRTLTDLVKRFGAAYAERKRRMGVMDFADLERFAYQLLHTSGSTDAPSEVAGELRDRFAHVLVDEFQDINPIQQAIIRAISRENDAARSNNLFVVGDVKQSIYRFRLAEPELFIERWKSASSTSKAPDNGGNPAGAMQAISLRENFRSGKTVIDAVNHVFHRIMGVPSGAILYDEASELRPGRPDHSTHPTHAVELHVLESGAIPQSDDGEAENEGETVEAIDAQSEETGAAESDRADHWNQIEREAFLIGRIMTRLVGGRDILPDGSALKYSDMSVLLRSRRINAGQVAAMLNRMGVPAFADESGSLFETREVRDMVAALQVIDNPRQDIPLASVLRSGILGVLLNQDELLELCARDRAVSFHAAARKYAIQGSNQHLRVRMASLFRRVDRFRLDARCRPIADVIWALYHEHGFLAHLCGLPRGETRRANLFRLHDVARSFGAFRRQGLHRFLLTIEAMQREDLDEGVAPTPGESGDVVRVMSIHQSKGLEFPVVFVAGLGKRFNTRDQTGRMIFERKTGIGLKVINLEKMVEYASAAHQWTAADIDRLSREEEMRILYVAMTRAREKLVLVGSRRPGKKELTPSDSRNPLGKVAESTLASAGSALDWLRAVIPCTETAASPPFDVHVHRAADMVDWSIETSARTSGAELLAAASRCDLLDAVSKHEENRATREVLAQVDYLYPHAACASVRAAIGASEVKTMFDPYQNPEERAVPPIFEPNTTSLRRSSREPVDPALRGILTHRVLQHLNYDIARSEVGLEQELRRMILRGWLTEQEIRTVDMTGLRWFVRTPLAEKIRSAGNAFRREFSYIAREHPRSIDDTVIAEADDMVLVRGIVDGILPWDDGIEIVDFKTDSADASSVSERAESHRAQMTMYSRAMERIWKRPVRMTHLVFLNAQTVVSRTGAELCATR